MKKKITLEQAAAGLSKILWSYLKYLPAKERRRRLEYAHRRLVERLKAH